MYNDELYTNFKKKNAIKVLRRKINIYNFIKNKRFNLNKLK